MKQPNAGSLRDARCAERLVAVIKALFETIDVNFPTPETFHENTLKAFMWCQCSPRLPLIHKHWNRTDSLHGMRDAESSSSETLNLDSVKAYYVQFCSRH
jgi:hypothetical protein